MNVMSDRFLTRFYANFVERKASGDKEKGVMGATNTNDSEGFLVPE